ncbi:phage replication initiation protein, NGO0469 family [Propionivibrio sp.]|uniref:phage replication initiation protein, NGO0469 family n=1 Tax=Propionivibrio sp. TaxID=2212460 RepID=UPI003BF15C31
MGFIAKDSGGGNFKRVPSGAFIGRCFSLIDLGTQRTEGQYGVKDQHKIQIGWELFGEDDDGHPLTVDFDGAVMPMTIKKSYTVSLHEKATLRKDLASWRGRDFTDEEAKAFDIAKLMGQYCMVNVTTSENGGKTYSNVGGLTKLPTAFKDAKPVAVHKDRVFDLDRPDMEMFNGFHEKLQEAIKKAPEWKGGKKAATEHQSENPGDGFDDMPDDLPF